MNLTKINVNIESYPIKLQTILTGSDIYDSSCSNEARVIFVKDRNCFIKSADKGSLKNEALLTSYFNKKKLAPHVYEYLSEEKDWLVTEKAVGEDCTHYLDDPIKLCDVFAESLVMLHNTDKKDCPVPYRTNNYLNLVEHNYMNNVCDASLFPDNWGYASKEDAWNEITKNRMYLKNDTLIHGDYCLPNVILNDFRFSQFIDLGNAGTGDKHIDIFWAIWTLNFNLKTDKYTDRFFDVYGRNNFNEELLKLIAACEVFG